MSFLLGGCWKNLAGVTVCACVKLALLPFKSSYNLSLLTILSTEDMVQCAVINYALYFYRVLAY